MQKSQSNSVFALMGRVLWMMFGPAAMFTAAAVLLTSPSDWWSVPSAIYLAALMTTVCGRWMEFAGGTPLNSDGQPATMEHLKRWTLIAVVGGIVGWLVVHLVGGFLS